MVVYTSFDSLGLDTTYIPLFCPSLRLVFFHLTSIDLPPTVVCQFGGHVWDVGRLSDNGVVIHSRESTIKFSGLKIVTEKNNEEYPNIHDLD